MHSTNTVLDLITVLVVVFSGGVLLFYAGRRVVKSGGVRRWLTPQAAPRSLSSRGYRLMQAGCITVTSVILVLPLAELGLRAYFSHYGSQDDRIRYVYSAEKVRSLSSYFTGLPYVGYGLSPDYPGHNRLGYRGPEIAQPKPPGVYRIVALGGSTTYGFGIERDENTWPGQLQRFLREDYGYEQVEVINAGVQEYTTWESLVNLEFRLLDLDPDLIIVYHATNDITARLVYPDAYDGLNSRRGLWRTGEQWLGPSTLLRFVAIRLGWMADPLALESQFVVDPDIVQCDMWAETACGAYDTDTLMQLNPPVYFERNLRAIAAAAQANGVAVMFSSWAYFPDTTPITNIYTFPWRRRAAAEHNAITQRVAEETGAAFYDLAARLDYNRRYWFDDGYHQTETGALEQARQYAAFIAAQGWLSRADSVQ